MRTSGTVVHVIGSRLRQKWSMQVGWGVVIETEENRRASKFREGSKRSGRMVRCS